MWVYLYIFSFFLTESRYFKIFLTFTDLLTFSYTEYRVYYFVTFAFFSFFLFFFLLQYRIPILSFVLRGRRSFFNIEYLIFSFVLRGRRIEGLRACKPLYAPSAQDKD